MTYKEFCNKLEEREYELDAFVADSFYACDGMAKVHTIEVLINPKFADRKAYDVYTTLDENGKSKDVFLIVDDSTWEEVYKDSSVCKEVPENAH